MHLFYIYTFLDGTTKSFERGCKATDKVDDCLTLGPAYPDAKLEACTVCAEDKCNDNSAASLTQSSTGMAAMVAAIIMSKMFQSLDLKQK